MTLDTLSKHEETLDSFPLKNKSDVRTVRYKQYKTKYTIFVCEVCKILGAILSLSPLIFNN